MDLQIFKKLNTWAVIVPALFGLWAVSASWSMWSSRSLAERRTKNVEQVIKDARLILLMEKRAGAQLTGRTSLEPFKGMTSARQYARAASISESRLSQGKTTGRPASARDGTVVRIQTYNIEQVRLLQIAQFVDFAERNFAETKCSDLAIERAPGKTRDNWKVNVALQCRGN